MPSGLKPHLRQGSYALWGKARNFSVHPARRARIIETARSSSIPDIVNGGLSFQKGLLGLKPGIAECVLYFFSDADFFDHSIKRSSKLSNLIIRFRRVR